MQSLFLDLFVHEKTSLHPKVSVSPQPDLPNTQEHRVYSKMDVQGNATNPFSLFSPGITYDVNVTCSGGSCSVTSGEHDGFPGYKIEVTNEAGETVTIYEYDSTAAGKGPMSLYPPTECDAAGGSECDKGVKIPEKKQNEEK